MLLRLAKIEFGITWGIKLKLKLQRKESWSRSRNKNIKIRGIKLINFKKGNGRH